MRTVEQVEINMAAVISQIADCKRVIKSAEEARGRLKALREELKELAQEYAEASETAEAMKAGRI